MKYLCTHPQTEKESSVKCKTLERRQRFILNCWNSSHDSRTQFEELAKLQRASDQHTLAHAVQSEFFPAASNQTCGRSPVKSSRRPHKKLCARTHTKKHDNNKKLKFMRQRRPHLHAKKNPTKQKKKENTSTRGERSALCMCTLHRGRRTLHL